MLPTIEKLREEYEELRKSIEDIKSPIVFAHNDLLLGNILVDHDANRVTFIDYEYAAFNFQAYDIGNHFDEFAGKKPTIITTTVELIILFLFFIVHRYD